MNKLSVFTNALAATLLANAISLGVILLISNWQA